MQIHGCHELRVLVTLLILTSIEDELQEFRITPVSQLGGIERQVDIDAANVFGFHIGKQEVGHPAADDHEGVTERGEDLSNIDEHATGGFDLTVGVVALVSRLWAHWTAATQAGFRRCWRMASAASSPRPPA